MAVVLKTEVPGPRSRELMQQVAEHTPVSLGHATPLVVERGEGALLTDVDGNTFIDFGGGIGTMNVGHSAPRVVEALKDQAGKLQHTCFMVAAYEPYIELAARLNRLSPTPGPNKTVLFNSGAEAVENAVKTARAFTGRPGVLCFDRAFHGRTMFSLGLTGQRHPYKAGFAPFPAEIYRLPFPYSYRPSGDWAQVLDDLLRNQVAPEQIACVLVEPVLGEGGFVVPPASFFKDLRRLCDEHGWLLIADEVQTGFGRTGSMFAVEHFGVAPDLLVTAKSLGGGTPISGITGPARIMDALATGSMGGTYGGNPLACRAALAALETIEAEGLCRRAATLGNRVRQHFEQLQERFELVGEVRGLGAMVAMELVKDRETREPATEETATLLKAALQRGLLLLKAGAGGNVVRALMPLVITDDELDEALSILTAAFEVTAREYQLS